MVKKTTETVSWSTFISWKYASTFEIMFCFQLSVKYLVVKKLSSWVHLSQKFLKDAILFNTCCRIKTLQKCGNNLLLIIQFDRFCGELSCRVALLFRQVW